MLCPPPPTLNPVTIFEAARLPHRANPSRAAGSFLGQITSDCSAPIPVVEAMLSASQKPTLVGRCIRPACAISGLCGGKERHN